MNPLAAVLVTFLLSCSLAVEPQVVVTLVLKTRDATFTCQDNTSLFRRLSQARANSESTPVVSQISCATDTVENRDGHRFVLLRLTFDANSLQQYASRQQKSLEDVINDILQPRLLKDEKIQVFSVNDPNTTSGNSYQMEGYIFSFDRKHVWSSGVMHQVSVYKHNYQPLIQYVQSCLQNAEQHTGDACQFEHTGYIYQMDRYTEVVLWFKNPTYFTLDGIKIQLTPNSNKELFLPEPQVVVMLVLITEDITFSCADTTTLYKRFSTDRANSEGKPVVNKISCPHVAEETHNGNHYVLLQLDFDANTFQNYVFRQKKTSEHVVKSILKPYLLADEEIEVYSVQEPATTSEYLVELDGFVLFCNRRWKWRRIYLDNVSINLKLEENLVKHVKYSIQKGENFINAYGFQIAYFYPGDEKQKAVVRFKTPHMITENEVKMLLTPTPLFQTEFDKEGLVVNVIKDIWNRPVQKPQILAMLALKTADNSFSCEDTGPLLRRFTAPEVNIEGTPVISQISCPKDTIETIDENRHALLQLNFDATTLREYTNRRRESLDTVVSNILRPRLSAGEEIQLVSIYEPDTTPNYLIQLDGIITLNCVREKWKSDFWINVQSFKQRYNEVLQYVESSIKQGTNLAAASQFQFGYFYRQDDSVRTVMWFKNPSFLTENEIRDLLIDDSLPSFRLFTADVYANVIEVNGNRPIIDTPEDFGHFLDHWID